MLGNTTRDNDMGCSSSNIAVADLHMMKPKWTCAVQVRGNLLKEKISGLSPGFRAINNNTLELTGNGSTKIDGARWSKGFTSGKHVMEFTCPVHLRGPFSMVGLGTAETELGGNRPKNTLGGPGTWAVDLESKRAISNGKNSGVFPMHKTLPDWFFMYMDLDEGLVQFGSDGEFFGTAFVNVRTDGQPLYPMVTAAKRGAIIGMVYRGEGKEINGPLRKKRKLERPFLRRREKTGGGNSLLNNSQQSNVNFRKTL